MRKMQYQTFFLTATITMSMKIFAQQIIKDVMEPF